MALIEEAKKAAELLLDHAYVRIVALEDPDALCASALLAHALRRENVDFHFTCLPRLDDAAMRALEEEGPEGLVLVGLSGDAADAPALAGRKVALDRENATIPAEARLDPTALEPKAPEPDLAALAYYVAVALSKRNRDLAVLVAAGAMANGHHVDGWKGLTADILPQAEEAGALLCEPGLALHGPTLEGALGQLDLPYVSGITGRARNAKKLLQELKLGGDAPPSSLQGEAAERLASFLALRLLAQDAPDAALGALARPSVRALSGPHTGLEAAALARQAEAACAAHKGGLGFAALWPDPATGAELHDAQVALREELVGALLRADRERAASGPLVVDAPSAGACAPLATRAAISFLAPGRLAVARHATDAGVHLAVRAVGGAVDVGKAARHAAQAAGCRVAASRSTARALVPAEVEGHFLKALAEALA